MKTSPTIYLDTSTINFLFADDAPELKDITIDLLENFIKISLYDTFISDFIIQEINQTDDMAKKNKLLKVIDDYPIELLDISEYTEIQELADLYILNNIIPEKKRFDSLHIACAVINKIDYLVGWNYKHLANVARERKILALNYQNNFIHPIRILTPIELINYDS